jgi:spore coat protein CotH
VRRARVLHLSSVALLLAACFPDVVGQEPADELFDPERVLEVAIEMDERDWDTVRLTGRSIDILVGDDCLSEPFGSPFSYLPATVTVDGVTVGPVGVRKKGFLGSLDSDKPSLKIKLHEYADDLRIEGAKRFTLNNAKQDPAFISQCLGYQLFAAAGLPASRCNFARVSVNGESLGLYVHVEPIKKPFLRRHYARDDGKLWEGTLSDFRPDWIGTFAPKNDAAAAGRAELDAMLAALESSDDELVAALEPLVDVDRFLTYWAVEVLLGHWDGYANNTNNYYLYVDPDTGKLDFIPWGIDQLFSDENPFPPGQGPPRAVYASGQLSRRLYLHPEIRDRYLSRLDELLDEIWDEPAILAEIDRMEDLILDSARQDPLAGGDVAARIEEVRAFVRGRRAALAPELATPPPWTYEPREPLCFSEIGSIEATFATTFGTLPDPNPFDSGTGTLTGTLEGAPIQTQLVGSKAGDSPDTPERVQVQVVALLDSDLVLVIVVEVERALFSPGASLSIDLSAAVAFVLEFDPATDDVRLVGLVLGGALTLEAAATTPGAPVEGSVSGLVVPWPP